MSESDSPKRPTGVTAYLLNGHRQTLNNVQLSLQMFAGIWTLKKFGGFNIIFIIIQFFTYIFFKMMITVIVCFLSKWHRYSDTLYSLRSLFETYYIMYYRIFYLCNQYMP